MHRTDELHTIAYFPRYAAIMSVWVTRSAPDNFATARGLKALGRTPLLLPVLTTRSVIHQAPSAAPEIVVFSSVHAVRHHRVPEHYRSVPVYASSGAIASAALAAGYSAVTSTGGSEDALCAMISHIMPSRGRVALFCAGRTGSTLRERLPAGVRLGRTVVYEPVAIADCELAAVRARLWQIEAITIHSCTAAERLGPLLEASSWRGRLWCISPQAGDRLPSLPGLSVAIAARPTESELMSLVAQHGNREPPARSLAQLPMSRKGSKRIARNDNEIPPKNLL